MSVRSNRVAHMLAATALALALGGAGGAQALTVVAPAQGEIAVSADVAWLALSNSDLATVRGGYFSVGGLNFDFGATVRTYVDGTLALESTLTWTPGGAQVTSASATGADLPQITTIAGVTGLSFPSSVARAVIRGSTGGDTVVLQQLGPSQISSVVLNTADNRNIRQDTDITLVLPAFSAMQHDFALRSLNSAFSDQMTAALRSSTPH